MATVDTHLERRIEYIEERLGIEHDPSDPPFETFEEAYEYVYERVGFRCDVSSQGKYLRVGLPNRQIPLDGGYVAAIREAGFTLDFIGSTDDGRPQLYYRPDPEW